MISFWQKFIDISIKYPNNIAIKDHGKVYSYRDLYDKASGIGEYLKGKGIKPEDIVALSFEKSADYIIALLGCWYAGCAFSPLPPSLPEDRLKYILDDLKPKLILDNINMIDAINNNQSPYKISENTLAYVIYTSGSTGKPKGVMVEHRGIVNCIEQQIIEFKMRPETVSFFHLSISFDASISDIGCALLSGSSLVIEDDIVTRDPVLFLKTITEHEITSIDMPPSLMKVFKASDMPESLETIVIGGEPSDPKTIRKWAAKFNLINVYGPTESTICTSLNRCDQEDWKRPIIGNPLKNVGYQILSDDMKDVDEGELYISGCQLARGYLNRPELNAEKFIIHNNERLYKTGDQVKRHKSGDIEFLGRLDRQFKLRGQLIEPDEIEQSLKSMDLVLNAAVVKINDQLVAFVITNQVIKRDYIKSKLLNKLPKWMIPDHIQFCKNLPKTSSGKIDYSSLSLNLNPKIIKEIPNTETEEKLYQIWLSVLGHKDFDKTDSFLNIGGDSLNIMNLSIAAEGAGISLPVATIIKYKTIEQIAKHLDHSLKQDNGAMKAEDLREFVRINYLDKFKPDANIKGNNPYEYIFLTGATGFLGGRVLCDILNNTDTKVYCLIRADNIVSAQRRIDEVLLSHGQELNNRVIPVLGNISKNNFGLSLNEYEDIAEICDAVYHNAAWVNTVLDFDSLRSTNLDGCFEILKFANYKKTKDLHYASTLSVFVATDQNKGVALETDLLDNTAQIYGGYAQTKWAADWMYSQISSNQFPIWNYRFGLITGDSQYGYTPSSDFLSMFFYGVEDLGCLPQLCDKGMNDLQIDITPVDYAVSAMTKISRGSSNGIYHIAGKDGYSYNRLIKTLKKEGVLFDMVSLEEWLNIPENKELTTSASAAYLALCRCLPLDQFNTHRMSDLFQATDVIFDQKNTQKALKSSNIKVTNDLDDLMSIYIKNHIDKKSTELRRKHV